MSPSDRFPADRRGISSQLSTVLTLGITMVLVSGLLIGVTGGIEDQERRAIERQLSIVGERVATEITGVDRLAYVSPNSTTHLETTHPRRVAGSRYTIALRNTEPPCERGRCLVLSASATETSVRVPFTTEAGVEPATVAGGPLEVTYNRTGRTIGVAER